MKTTRGSAGMAGGPAVAAARSSGDSVVAWWFNPRSGDAMPIGRYANSGTRTFTPPSQGFGSDWVLAADDASRRFGAPGALIERSRRGVNPR